MSKQNQLTVQRVVSDTVSGTVAATVGSIYSAPVKRVQLLLQNQDASVLITRKNKYKGILDCVKRVYHEQGLLSFYRGNFVHCASKVIIA